MAATRERITNTGLGMQTDAAVNVRKRAWAIGERDGYLQLALRDAWYQRDPDGIWTSRTITSGDIEVTRW